MKPKLIDVGAPAGRIRSLPMEPQAWSGANQSGIRPLGNRVLVLPDIASHRTASGIELPADVVERMTMASERGTLVAAGAVAFSRLGDSPPAVGSRVHLERYSGEVRVGTDGLLYRLMEDRCIGAVDEPAAASEEVETNV